MSGPNRARFNVEWLLRNKTKGVPCGISIGHRDFSPENGTCLKVDVEGFGQIEVDLDDDDLLRIAGQALSSYMTKQKTWDDSRPTREDVIKRLKETMWF